MGIRVAGMTHPGCENQTNQDVVYAKTWLIPECEVGVIAIADGMGGYTNGEVAAKTAIECVGDYFDKAFKGVCSHISALSGSLDAVFYSCHERINRINHATGNKSGTTLTVCALLGSEYIVKNIGDTRCYIASSDKLRQISIDDSWIAQQIRMGVLTESGARNHEKQNLLTKCLGIGFDANPHSSVGVLNEGEVLAVCSDGFYKTLDPSEISAAIAVWRDEGGNPLSLVLKSLFGRNETDNISLCLMSASQTPQASQKSLC